MPADPTALTPALISATWSPREVALSPDGRQVAWVAQPFGRDGEHDVSGLWVAPVDGSSPARRWTHAAADTNPRWSPDGRRLAFCSDRAERGTPGLYVLDLDGGEARPLVVRKRAVSAAAWSPDGTRLAFLARDEPTEEDERRDEERDDAEVFGERLPFDRLWIVAVQAGDGSRTADPAEPELRWAPDLHLQAPAWSPEGSRLAVLARPTPTPDTAAQTAVWTLDAAGAAPPVEVCDAGYAGDLAWVGDHRLVFSAPHESTPQSGGTAWAVDADAGATPRVVGTGPDEPRCTGGLVPAPGERRVVLVVLEGLDTRLEWSDVGSGERTLLYASPGELAGASVVTGPSGPVLAVIEATPTRLPEVLAGPPDRLAQRSDHTGALADLLAPTEDLHTRAVDGLDLDAVVIRPRGTGDGPFPTAVLVHGGPYGRSGRSPHLHPLDWGQLLAGAGYAVVLPNYRGGIGHGNAFATSVRGDMGGAEWGDVLSLVDAAVEAGIADPDRIGIGGWSQGGFLTAWAVTATDRFAAGVMGAGVSDWGMLAATSDMPDFEAVLGGDHRWDGPGPHLADVHSPISYAQRRSAPLLILHGERDERVPVTQAFAFHRALAGQDAPLVMVTYPREPHGIRERRHQEDVQERVLAWFRRFV